MFIAAAAHFGPLGAERARRPRSKMARRTVVPKMTLSGPLCGPKGFRLISTRVCSGRGFGAFFELHGARAHARERT